MRVRRQLKMQQMPYNLVLISSAKLSKNSKKLFGRQFFLCSIATIKSGNVICNCLTFSPRR